MERISSKSDDIDLLTIALVLWAKRNTLIASTLGFVVAGILFAYAQTTIYQGKIVINPLTDAELAGFNEWNQGISGATSFDRLGVLTSNTSLHSSKVDSESLLKKFRAYFQRGEALNSALREHSKEIKNFKGDALELAASMARLRRNFVLEEDEFGEIIITITTSDKVESLQILSTVVESISQAVKQDSLQTINSILAAKELSRQLEIERLSVDIEAYKSLYNFRKNRSLTLLREQASIARTLGLESPVLSGDRNQTSTGVVNFERNELDPFESSYFLQGYNAIEKQIANVEMRDQDDINLMTDNAEDLILAQERLERYSIAETLRPLIDDTPFHDPDFMIVQTNLNNLDFISQTNKALLAGMVAAVGFLLSIVTVLVGHAIQQRDVETGAA